MVVGPHEHVLVGAAGGVPVRVRLRDVAHDAFEVLVAAAHGDPRVVPVAPVPVVKHLPGKMRKWKDEDMQKHATIARKVVVGRTANA